MKRADIISRMAEKAGIKKAQADKALEGLKRGFKCNTRE